jgi:hypothetical protein
MPHKRGSRLPWSRCSEGQTGGCAVWHAAVGHVARRHGNNRADTRDKQTSTDSQRRSRLPRSRCSEGHTGGYAGRACCRLPAASVTRNKTRQTVTGSRQAHVNSQRDSRLPRSRCSEGQTGGWACCRLPVRHGTRQDRQTPANTGRQRMTHKEILVSLGRDAVRDKQVAVQVWHVVACHHAADHVHFRCTGGAR